MNAWFRYHIPIMLMITVSAPVFIVWGEVEEDAFVLPRVELSMIIQDDDEAVVGLVINSGEQSLLLRSGKKRSGFTLTAVDYENELAYLEYNNRHFALKLWTPVGGGIPVQEIIDSDTWPELDRMDLQEIIANHPKAVIVVTGDDVPVENASELLGLSYGPATNENAKILTEADFLERMKALGFEVKALTNTPLPADDELE